MKDLTQNIHSYGSSAALCVSPSPKTPDQPASLYLEASQKRDLRQYDWANKRSILLSQDELLDLYAFLNGYKSEYRLAGHGQQHQKTFSIIKRDGGYLFSLKTKGEDPFVVKVQPATSVRIALLALSQLKHNLPNINANDLLLTYSKTTQNLAS